MGNKELQVIVVKNSLHKRKLEEKILTIIRQYMIMKMQLILLQKNVI